MPTQKVFKRRVRARMAKTGEAYTTARQQLIRKATGDAPAGDPAAEMPVTGAATPDEAPTGSRPTEPVAATPADAGLEDEPAGMPSEARTLTSDEAMVRGTGRPHADWFGLLDAWSATDHRHPEIAAWLRETHGVPGWWAQNITVAYERARGMRRVGQMADGFQVAVTRTVNADPHRTLAAFVDAAERAAWLPEPMRQRPTRAAHAARFDWADPASRVVVALVPRADGRTVVSLTHEKLPDAATAQRFKSAWRGWLGALKARLENG